MSTVQKVRDVGQHQTLYLDADTGIAWVENGSLGLSHSCHPNIDRSGSVAGMKALGYWSRDDRTVESHGFIFNIDECIVSDELDELARDHCRCGGKH